MSEFYTYFHTRNDTGAIFYVGKGKGLRAYDTRRNRYWNAVTAKHGHTVHIASKWNTEKEALEHEKFLILCFKDMGIQLTNITDGGEGWSGAIHTQEFKLFMSAKMKGRQFSEKTISKMSESAKLRFQKSGAAESQRGAGNPMANSEVRRRNGEAQRGKTISLEHRAKISFASKGRISPNKGKTLSLECRAKMSLAGKGKPKSEEHKAKIKASLVARVLRLKLEKSK